VASAYAGAAGLARFIHEGDLAFGMGRA
jgi:hypothetical protein